LKIITITKSWQWPSRKEFNMQRLAFKMKLNPGQEEAYTKRHKELWPEVQQLLKEAGVSEYSIFLDEETHTLFAFQKLSGDASSQDLAENPIVKKWWAYMANLMETNPDNSPVSLTLKEVFYME
jgi:L-rhamnose mutarotase